MWLIICNHVKGSKMCIRHLQVAANWLQSMQGERGGVGDREHIHTLGAWLQQVVPRLEDLIAASYPLRKPAAAEPGQAAAPAGAPATNADALGKGMVHPAGDQNVPMKSFASIWQRVQQCSTIWCRHGYAGEPES